MDSQHRIRDWLIVLVWLMAAVASAVFLTQAQQPFKIGSITDPNSESKLAEQTMESRLPYGGSRIFILYESDKWRANDPRFASQVKQSLDGLRHFPLSHHILSPYQNPHQISKNKHAAYAVVVINNHTADESSNLMREFYHAIVRPKDLKMYIGGQPVYIANVTKLSRDNMIRGETIALPLSVIALIFIFRGIIAAILPLVSGVISITLIVATLFLLGREFDLTIFVLNIATMLGLGLTLDYSLIITYRFREEMARGRDTAKAIKITMATAGKAVFFSGLTVTVSLASLLFFPINVLYSIGMAGVVVVLVALLSALTFLPALLSMLGDRVNAWSLPILRRSLSVENASKCLWFRVANQIMKHPFLISIPTVIFLIFLGYPFLNVKLSRSDATILPTWSESRQLQDQFAEFFNPNELSPIDVLLTSKNHSILTRGNISSLYNFAHHLQEDPRVESVRSIVTVRQGMSKMQYEMLYSSGLQMLSADQREFFHETTKGKYTVMNVFSKFPVNNENSMDLVRTIRTASIGNDINKQVTGGSAIIVDTIHSAYTLFFKVICVISIITYVILMILLRSIFLPFKAIVMNFLSLSVCYGMLVFIFQEGHFASFLNFKPQGMTDLNLPILLFFALFGLSMDYEVFLLTRIKEFYDRTGDNKLSVALGLERSARIITSAALLVVIVAGAFVTADIVFIKAFGLGTALAVAVDASVIRILLVPATMRMLGKWNWYLPKWLGKILPTVKFYEE